ncbi:MAG: hypothetical protein FGM15_11585 [Chthoniobacterales bacterium]|nr:hypothetical protein [Chthoniobacterales bacterium]
MDLDVKAMAFVRRFKRDQESRFQQSLREPGNLEMSKPRSPGFLPFNYRNAISRFDDLLGPTNVAVLEFDPRKFSGGCVVKYFCQAAGIAQKETAGDIANESLSAEALNLLYAYRLYGPGYGQGWKALRANSLLIDKLQELKGPRLFFHSSLLTKAEDKWRADLEWTMQRTGFDLLGNIYEDDEKPCVRREEDMHCFTPESLDWLAHAIDVRAGKLRNARSEEVAAAMGALYRKLAHRTPLVRARDFLRNCLSPK